MDFSIVIPTWNRSNLVDELLNSLFEERIRYQDGKTEVIVVDQCHLLRWGIRKNIFNSSMNLVYLRIHLKSWDFVLAKIVFYDNHFFYFNKNITKYMFMGNLNKSQHLFNYFAWKSSIYTRFTGGKVGLSNILWWLNFTSKKECEPYIFGIFWKLFIGMRVKMEFCGQKTTET